MTDKTVRSSKRAHGCPASTSVSSTPQERGEGEAVRRSNLNLMTLQHHPASRPFKASKHPLMIDAFLPFRALPDHAGKTLQRHQRLAGIGPFLQFLDRDVIEWLAAGSAGKERTRDVHHVWRTGAFVKKGRAAGFAKTAHGFCGLFIEAR